MKQSFEYQPLKLKKLLESFFEVENVGIRNKKQIKSSLKNLIELTEFSETLKVGKIDLIDHTGSCVDDRDVDNLIEQVSFEIKPKGDISFSVFLVSFREFQNYLENGKPFFSSRKLNLESKTKTLDYKNVITNIEDYCKSLGKNAIILASDFDEETTKLKTLYPKDWKPFLTNGYKSTYLILEYFKKENTYSEIQLLFLRKYPDREDFSYPGEKLYVFSVTDYNYHFSEIAIDKLK